MLKFEKISGCLVAEYVGGKGCMQRSALKVVESHVISKNPIAMKTQVAAGLF
jgi:hypothetical protein